MPSQATNKLEILNGQPSVTKLWNGRFRLEFYCNVKAGNEGWYSSKVGQILPDFLSSQGDSLDGNWQVPTGAEYADMRLVEASIPYVSNLQSHFVSLVYETLTGAWVQEVDDSISYDNEGLCSLSRQSVALPDTAYSNTVGTTTITSDGKTLYLGSYQIEKTDAKWTLVEKWIESGILSVSVDNDSITNEVSVNAINMTAEEVRAAVSEVTANHSVRAESIQSYNGLESINYSFEIRSTATATELGDSQIGVEFETGVQTDGSSDFIIVRQYSVSSANVSSSIVQLTPPALLDPVFDGTGGTQKAYIVDQDVKPNGKEGAVLTRTFAMVPSKIEEWDEMVIQFPGVEKGPFQLDVGFQFRTSPYSEAVPVRIIREFFLSNPSRIFRPGEFRPVDSSGNRTSVLNENSVPTADEYVGYVNSGRYLTDRVSIKRWQGDIWERQTVKFKAE